jgi:hypothetical protein
MYIQLNGLSWLSICKRKVSEFERNLTMQFNFLDLDQVAIAPVTRRHRLKRKIEAAKSWHALVVKIEACEAAGAGRCRPD